MLRQQGLRHAVGLEGCRAKGSGMNISANFYLTKECNFKCEHCMHNCGPQAKGFMTNKQIIFAVNLLRKIVRVGHKISVVGLTGGEPMLHPTFSALVKSFKTPGAPPIELHTNGSITGKFPSDLQFSIMNVFVPIDPFHDKFRKNGNDVEFRELSKLGPVTISTATAIKKKGRAKEFIEENNRKYFYDWCIWKHIAKDPKNIASFNFGYDGIRFCGESWNKEKNPKNFAEYDEAYLENPDLIVEKSNEYINKFSYTNCAHRCKLYSINREENKGQSNGKIC